MTTPITILILKPLFLQLSHEHKTEPQPKQLRLNTNQFFTSPVFHSNNPAQSARFLNRTRHRRSHPVPNQLGIDSLSGSETLRSGSVVVECRVVPLPIRVVVVSSFPETEAP